VSHNEEPSVRSIHYLAGRTGHPRNRELVRQLALVIQSKGAKWSFQSDWNFLQRGGGLRYRAGCAQRERQEPPALVRATGAATQLFS